MVRWKPCGRVRQGAGAVGDGRGLLRRAEPRPGALAGQGLGDRPHPAGPFRRAPQPKQGQRLVPRDQNYPNGLTFTASPATASGIDDVIIFRGVDVEPPERRQRRQGAAQGRRPGGVLGAGQGQHPDGLLPRLRGQEAADRNAPLDGQAQEADVADSRLTVVAVDLYGNASEPSQVVAAPKGKR